MKRMKDGQRLALKFLLIALCATLILCGLNAVYVKGYYYTDTYGEVQKFSDVPYGITMANFGTSHGLASFRYPEAMGEVTFNFALSGQDIYHDLQALKQYADHMEKGCIVAIPTSYFSFCMSLTDPSQKRYYCYLEKQYLRGFSYEVLLNTKLFPVLRSGEYLFKDLIKDQSFDVTDIFLEDEPLSGGADLVPPEGMTGAEAAANAALKAHEKSLREHALLRSESWRSGYMITGGGNMEGNRALLTEMIEFCLERGFRPVLVTTPVHYTLNEAFTAEELETYYFANVRAVSEATGVPYLDLSHDAELSANAAYYNNSDHTNVAGAEAFFEKYMAFLGTLGYVSDRA